MSKSNPDSKKKSTTQEQGGGIKLPKTPPQPTTAAQTNEFLKMPDNIRNRLNKYLSILNENSGALVPHIIAEIGRQQEKHPDQYINFWEVLDQITNQEPQALAILERARESLKKSQILESPENKISKPTPQVKEYGLLNDKINHELICGDYFNSTIDGQLCMVFETNQASKGDKPINVITALSYEGPQPLISKKLTGYDRSIYNAVSTLCHYSQEKYTGEPCIITPQEIWRTMNGITDKSRNPSPAQVKKVCSSMDKMRFTRIMLDISEEVKKHNLQINDERLLGGVIDT